MEPMSAGGRVSPVETSVARRPGSGDPVPSGEPVPGGDPGPRGASVPGLRARVPRAAEVAVTVSVLAAAVAVDPGGLRAFTSLRWLLVSAAMALAAAVVLFPPARGADRP